MEKESRFILAQVDHVSGEVLGYAVEKLMELGARNVQLISTITKKNRPGNIILIDADTLSEERISTFLTRELKISGYHRINTSHVFHKVTFVAKTVRIRLNGRSKSFQCRLKLIGEPSDPITIDVEHDFLVNLQETINSDWNIYFSLEELRNRVETPLRDGMEEITITI